MPAYQVELWKAINPTSMSERLSALRNLEFVSGGVVDRNGVWWPRKSLDLAFWEVEKDLQRWGSCLSTKKSTN